MPPVLFFVFFACLIVAYLLGLASILLSQYFGRRSLSRRLHVQEDEGYTLRVVRSPGDYVGEDAQEDEEV